MPERIAIIDLGSNTTRMVIYEYERDRYFRLQDEIREVVRLREGMGRTNVLRAAAIERAINAMRMFRELAEDLHVNGVIAVATSAVRDAVNRDSFLARVKAETGWELRLLSGEEEGYYGALGAVNATCLRSGFVLDLGGGSVQIVQVEDGIPGRAVSLPLGSLRLTELFLSPDRISADQVTALRGFIREQLAEVPWFRAEPGRALVAIGGAIRNLGKIDQVRKHYPLDTVHGYRMATKDVASLADELWRYSLKKRRNVRGLRADRADIMPAAAIAYDELLRHSGFDALIISRPGLREGLFFEHFLAHRPHPLIPDLRRFSILSLARIFGYDDPHSHHVAFLANRLFDDLQGVHGLDASYRELLWAASILHDIGAIINYPYHHRHSYYIILNYTLYGYSPRELALIALIARFHRSKGNPKPRELAPLLTREDVRALPILCGMIRLAEYLERGRRQVIRDLRCHVDMEQGWMQIEALAAGNAAIELWEAERNLEGLRQALGMDVELVEGVWVAET
ncbi:MAG TPA: Ppx/GppA family phosphatase [Anaerolineae bacterium]|nr:Ppx/GppA family phosphatase [Anaerolineae bacterium]